MQLIPTAWTPRLYAVMRIVVGALYACHGAQKLFGALGADAVSLGTLLGGAGIIEFFGGALIVLGFLTPVVAFVTSGQMAAAYFISHAPQGFWPIMNRGELAVLYCFVFLFVAAHGSGPWSIDAMRRTR
jgi:putative oxidoreductase